MSILDVITLILLLAGSFFMLVASIGMIRLPDFYTRMHAGGKADTLGQGLIFLGLIIYEGFTLISLKMLIIFAFIFIANPTATHAVAKAAYKGGLKIWSRDSNDSG
ncbi:MAG: monovalent cation/H(+) antiporter subunit G [Flexistipes sinusarabici]|uniref:Monovalent cation/H(+) antiporter subunit G n=1 Tax=Flexistipes sinusarabici TaxID=2352 RepID=A0A5D0MP25_FLESI|nr:monovalent cation/H(+) antiporter subunit G [Flexistipes sinusarabici]TYB33343.1 MAG: monovalent cation/H(+) antiporter subunit G [Flexistipes sinusarabici]